MEYWDGFDTSHWKTTDKAWMAERKQQWLEIEKLLYVLDKNKKARSIIKQYFLKGQLPDWKKLHDWSQGSTTRHLDLLLKYKGEYVGPREMRKHATWYTRGITHGAILRDRFNKAATREDFKAILDEFFGGYSAE